eukprot:XP_001703884.1 Hypothetical protein GL50803_31655 [Giardia lamblia ATCC 50803]
MTPFLSVVSEHSMHSLPFSDGAAGFLNRPLSALQVVHTPLLAAVQISLHYHPLSHTITHYHPLSPTVQHSLPKYLRLPPAHEPPAEEADEAPHNNDHGDGDARDGARAEPAPVGARGHTLTIV